MWGCNDVRNVDVQALYTQQLSDPSYSFSLGDGRKGDLCPALHLLLSQSLWVIFAEHLWQQLIILLPSPSVAATSLPEVISKTTDSMLEKEGIFIRILKMRNLKSTEITWLVQSTYLKKNLEKLSSGNMSLDIIRCFYISSQRKSWSPFICLYFSI